MSVKSLAKAAGSASWEAIKKGISVASEWKTNHDFKQMLDREPGKVIHGLAKQIDSNRSDIRRLRQWFDDCRFTGGPPTVQVRKVEDIDPPLPEYQTSGAAGLDLRAYGDNLKASVLSPGESEVFRTGLEFNIPTGYHGRVTLRSSMRDRGLSIPQNVGVIDSDYTGEVKIPIVSRAGGASEVDYGERIAQMVIMPSPQVDLAECESINDTERGDGSFGSTGRS